VTNYDTSSKIWLRYYHPESD